MKMIGGISTMALVLACAGGMTTVHQANAAQVVTAPVTPVAPSKGSNTNKTSGQQPSRSTPAARAVAAGSSPHANPVQVGLSHAWGGMGQSFSMGSNSSGSRGNSGIGGNGSEHLQLNGEYERGFKERYNEMMGSGDSEEESSERSAGGIGGIGATHLNEDSDE